MANDTRNKIEQNNKSDEWEAMPFRRCCREKAQISPSHDYSLVKKGRIKLTHLGKRSLITRIESDRIFEEGA
jgi:hypothetical protein